MEQNSIEMLQSYGSIFEKSAKVKAMHDRLQILKKLNSQDGRQKLEKLHALLSVI